MKKYAGMIWGMVLIMAALSGCGNKEQKLDGTYGLETYVNQMTYQFDKEGNVAVQVSMAGFVVFSQEGTYTIDSEKGTITLSFPTDGTNGMTGMPEGMTSLGGTFTFQEGEDYILIGTARYEKYENENETGAANEAPSDETNSSVQPAQTPDTELTDIVLRLPDAYSVEYSVTEETGGLHRTYLQKMVCTEQGIYLELGDSGEKYIFERLDSGKYIQYRCNSLTGKYETPMISAAVQEQIDNGTMTIDMAAVDQNMVNGFVSRISTYFDFYKTFHGTMTYDGEEAVGDVLCQKYSTTVSAVQREQNVEMWIDPVMGICMKGVYEYVPSVGATGSKTIECTKLEIEDVVLPDYKSE